MTGPGKEVRNARLQGSEVKLVQRCISGDARACYPGVDLTDDVTAISITDEYWEDIP